MENTIEIVESLKTPKRTRKMSIKELHVKQLESPEIAEINELHAQSSCKKDLSITPSHSTRTLDFQTPSRSHALRSTQTPRRSCRKSIKPIQEYENIVAQKGLSAKRLVTDPSINDETEEVDMISENKWEPSVIGRVSTKRGKKARRNKNKKLQRQKNIIEDETRECKIEEVEEKSEDTNKHVKKLLIEAPVNYDENIFTKEKEDRLLIEKLSTEKPLTEELSTEKTIPEESSTEEPSTEEPLTEEPPTETIQIDENHANISDDSMEGEDIILNSMPITADDCLQSPEKNLQLAPKNSLSVSAVRDSANKTNDSDCIMLSLSDSSPQEQSTQNIFPTPVVVAEPRCQANESSDSVGINMPPLLICSDDEDDEEFVDAHSTDDPKIESPIKEINCASDEPDILNLTFDAQDKIEEYIDLIKSPEDIKKIIHGMEEKQPNDILSKFGDEHISSLDRTFEADDESLIKTTLAVTPNIITFRPSITHVPTPFKTKKSIVPDIIIEPEDEMDATPEVIMEPREIKLKSSRKRSFSMCVDRPKKNVTFHSPTNTTDSIYQQNLIKSSSKQNPTNITKRRRKRSLSVTETEKELMDYIQYKKPIQKTTPQKKPLKISRIKMPNFSNLHQKQFQMMESITDHVARKAERAKILTNSNIKIKPASVQKGLPVKNSILRENNNDGKKTQQLMPKARQRIDMSASTIDLPSSLHNGTKFRSKSKQDLLMLDDLPSIGKVPSKISKANSTSMISSTTKPNNNKLPKPKFNFNFNSTNNVALNSTTLPSCNTKTSIPKPIRVHLPNPKNFNLSTTINTTSLPDRSEKLEDRRKRMMDMFKARSTQRVGENNKEILKGVRTNRRFELQMMCRNRQK